MAFKELAAVGDPRINVERFFEFAWMHRDRDGQSWEALLHSAIFVSIVFQMASLIENPSPTTLHQLTASQAVARYLAPRDLVVNLNYDTVFEIGLKQAGVAFAYAPTPQCRDRLPVAKPHGSINFVLTDTEVRFGDPEHFQTLTYPDEQMAEFRGIVPPRFNKSFAQHPLAAKVHAAIRPTEATSLMFWASALPIATAICSSSTAAGAPR